MLLIEEGETFNFFFDVNNWFVTNFWEYCMKIHISRINNGIFVTCNKLFLTIIEIDWTEGYFWNQIRFSLLELKNFDELWSDE